MTVELLKIMANVGLFVLIWMIQLVVYPSFHYYSESHIKKWHPIYTRKITYIVLPLMLIQIITYLFSVFQTPDLQNVISLVLVLSTWLVTVFIAVPLHHKIDQQENSTVARRQLVNINWLRTGIWSIILIISLMRYGK